MAISDLQAAVTSAASTAASNPTSATQEAYVDALEALIDAVNDGHDDPTSPYYNDPDLADAYANLANLNAQLEQAKIDAAQQETLDYQDATSDATTKNYQITVPNFKEGTAPLGVTKLGDGTSVPALTSATSFLRLGSSPTTAEWTTSPYKASANLARLVGDPTLIASAEGLTVTDGQIAGVVQDDSNASTLTTTQGSSSYLANFQDGRGVQTTTSTYGSHQDSNFLLGFADDVRNRGPLDSDTTANALHPRTTNVNNVATSNINQNRQTETLRLLTKGGWWDHSDGNRVTTTSGDKIEVIQGNYKLVVLGRQSVPDPPGDTATQAEIDAYKAKITSLTANTFITDVSGGHFEEQYPSPTPCIKTIEYVQDEGGEWTLYQDNGIGNLITKLKGRTVDLFQGSKREAYVGSKDGATSASLDPEIVAKTWAQKIYSQTGSEAKPIGKGTTPKEFPSSMPADSSSLNAGDVLSVTWAQRIMSYTGSSRTPVPYVYSETYAGQIKSVTTTEGGSITSTTTATGGNITTTTTATSSYGGRISGGKIQNTTSGSLVTNVSTASGFVANVTAAGGSVINVTSALAALNLNTALEIINLNIGAMSIVNLNLGLSMFNIDLTPISVHCGALSYELATSKWVAAPNVQLGAAPLPLGVGKAVVAMGMATAVLQSGLGTVE
jgi:hypothetical protein